MIYISHLTHSCLNRTTNMKPQMCSDYFVLFSAEEFVAHGANVNCLALGHKSGRVLVTGGDDKKVNLWAVGKPNCILVSAPVILQGDFFLIDAVY